MLCLLGNVPFSNEFISIIVYFAAMMFAVWILYSNRKNQRAIRALLDTARNHDAEKYVVRTRLSEAQNTVARAEKNIEKLCATIETQKTKIELLSLDNETQKTQIGSLLQDNKAHKTQIGSLLQDNKAHKTQIGSLVQDNKAQSMQIESLSHTVLRLACNRAIVLATQVLYLYIGRQPKTIRKGPNVFESALKKDPKYAFVLAGIFGADTIESQAGFTAKFDELLDNRNALVHPSSVSALAPEARDLVATLDTFARAGHALNDSEITAKMVLAGVY